MTPTNNTDRAADMASQINEALVANSTRRYVKIVYGSVPERTSLDETIQKGGVVKQLEAAWSLIEIYAERVGRAFESRTFKSRAFETSGGRDVAYEADDLMGDCDATIEVLNDLIRTLIRDKNALYEIINDLELEKLKADGSYPLHDFGVRIESSGEGRESILADVAKAYAAGNAVYISVSASFNPSDESDENKGDSVKNECCDSVEEFINFVKNLTPEGDDYYVVRATIYPKMEIPY